MANVKDLLVNGSARVIGTIYGNATSANNSDKLDGKHLNEIAAAKSTILAWNTSSTVATIGGNNITITMPANPNTWRGIQNNLTSDSTTDSLSAAQGKALKTLVDGKAASSHTHDDRYYTESEINTKLNGKSDIGHTHDNRYYTESEIDTKLNGKANTSHGTHIPSTCTSITDWNSATTNGWYMGSNISNQPVTNGGWFYGLTVVHNSNYIRQIAWHFASDNSVSGTNNDRYERVKYNGTWGNWVNTSVRKAVPSNAKFTDTTYSAATTSVAGLMSASDKSKLDGITASADSVSFSRSLTSGTKVGTITINGTGTDLYAPTNTDTHWTTRLKVGASNTATANAAASNGSVYLNVLDNSTVRDSHKITGSGATSVTSDANGVITISSTNTTYGVATTSANGLMSSTDKSKLDGIAAGANNYSLPAATSSALGGVKIGSNITVSSGTISLTKANVTNALGYTPPTTDTNTWKANTASSEGYVASGSGQANKVWKTDANGVPAWRADANTTYSVATTSANGLMSSSDKSKLDGIATGATKVTIDSSLSSTSTNPVQNKVINSALAGKAASSHTHDNRYYTESEINTKINTINTAISNISTVYYGDGVDSAITPLNADQLQGHPANYFATSEKLDTKANKNDVLTLEEIQASTDLNGKIASANALKDVNDKLGNFRYFGSFRILSGETLTIDGFNPNQGYLIVDVHINNGVAMYITSAGYHINMPLYHIAGNNKLTLIRSTEASITVQSTATSSLVILELGIWY